MECGPKITRTSCNNVSIVFVTVVLGQRTEKVATLGQMVVLPCHIDVADAPSDIQVVIVSLG